VRWASYPRIPDAISISRKEVERVLLSFPPCNTLDVGSGYGRISRFLKANGFRVAAIDKDMKMIQACKALGITTYLMSARNLRFPSDTFELVITDGLLEHFENPLSIIREEARVSNRWVLNFVPTNGILNAVFEKIQRVPKEYRRSTEDWLALHQSIFSRVSVTRLSRLIAIKCLKQS
jgi:SAM-dependent methyltransferase